VLKKGIGSFGWDGIRVYSQAGGSFWQCVLDLHEGGLFADLLRWLAKLLTYS